eukprot:TRINITY_DN23114_c0_g1_i1.p1 TRINITY_DN23114_c0_g1~~TRINITY_DN23114_c0_g1_i1.p1  ORF type:complete len:230 (-),score=56.14 TRINITY_DN23114_c0_g1_i1:60-749(-)
MVSGVRIDGATLSEEELAVSEDWEKASIPELLGVPLRMKRLSEGQSQDAKAPPCLASRLITEPSSGMPPAAWRGALGPVLAGRADGVAFTCDDCALLDEYISWCAEEAEKAVRRGKAAPQMFTPQAFLVYLQRAMSVALANRKSPTAFLDLEPELAFRFPKGAKVKPKGLTKAELNGTVGTVTGQYDKDKWRVGIQFPEPHGTLSVKAQNLEPEETYEEWSSKLGAEYA